MSDSSEEERQEQKNLEEVTRGRLESDFAAKNELKEMSEGWNLLEQELRALEKSNGVAEGTEGFAGRLKAKLALECQPGNADEAAIQGWVDDVLRENAEEASVQLPLEGQRASERNERWGMMSILLVAATAVCVVFAYQLTRDQIGKPANPSPAIVRVKPETTGELSKVPPRKEVVTPEAIAGANLEPKEMVSPSVRQSPGKSASKTVWTDPLDARITKASAKLTKKPAALAGVMDHSLQRLDRRMAKLATQMAQEKL